jgi:hypothetical protein
MQSWITLLRCMGPELALRVISLHPEIWSFSERNEHRAHRE